MSIIQLKEKIAELTGQDLESQRLIFGGRVLENDKLISDYGLKKSNEKIVSYTFSSN